MMDIRVSNSKSSGLIDGFVSVQAAKRAARRTPEPAEKTPDAPVAPDAPADASGRSPAAIGARIHRTTVPDKFEIVCYECHYVFPMTGRIRDTVCPRCRANLEKKDYLLDREPGPAVKTIGTVQLRPNGSLTDTRIVAQTAILAGDATKASIECQLLQLRTGVSLNLANVKARDVLVDGESVVTLRQKLTCHNLEVRGELNASALTSGTILVKTGGHLKGNIQTAHLIVEDGGGLTAMLDVGPHISSEPAPRRAEPRAETAPAPVAPSAARRKTRMTTPPTTRKK